LLHVYYSLNDRKAKTNIFSFRGRRGRDRMVADVVSSNLNQGEVYNIMWYSLSLTCDR